MALTNAPNSTVKPEEIEGISKTTKTNDQKYAQGQSTVPGLQEQPVLVPAQKRNIKIEELYGRGEVPMSPKGSNSISGNQPEEIKSMYLYEYARGIDMLLETEWYTKEGLKQLIQDARLRSSFAGLLELMRNTKSSDFEMIQKIPPIESKVIWKLMCMPRVVFEKAKENRVNPFSDPHLQDALYRLQVVEALICNKNLAGGYVWPTGNNAPHKARENQFWRQMGGMLALPVSDRVKIDGYLSELRKLLDVREARDVLYSAAVVRHFGVAPPPQPKTLAEAAKHSRDITTQKVAKKFLEDEAANKGTTQVMQRICGMLVRSWAIQGCVWYSHLRGPSHKSSTN